MACPTHVSDQVAQVLSTDIPRLAIYSYRRNYNLGRFWTDGITWLIQHTDHVASFLCSDIPRFAIYP